MNKQPSKAPRSLTLAELPFGVASLRGLDYPFPSLPGSSPRFDFLFPGLQANPDNLLPKDALGQMDRDIVQALDQLGGEMVDPGAADGDNPDIPSAYTYFGQFVDHDLTLDLTSVLTQFNDPAALSNFRDPAFNLDSLYGSGPGRERYLFDVGSTGQATLIRRTGQLQAPNTDPLIDLQRNEQGTAIVPDPRNDENLVVAQMHVAFVRFHNKVADLLSSSISPGSLFSVTARKVVLHYQWVVLHDFLPRLVEQTLIDSLISEQTGPIFVPGEPPFMPIEFAVAAYRFGHTMVRETYDFNEAIGPAGLGDLFGFTKSPVPDNWAINWTRFLETNNANPHNFARKFDTQIAPGLHAVPIGDGTLDLPKRNLQRGYALNLPTGQAVAGALGQTPLTPAEVSAGHTGTVFADHPILAERTPLWFYILREASLQSNGLKLGAVGQRVVAEVFIGLLKADPSSILNSAGWKPSLPSAIAGTFTLDDLITLANTE